MRACVNYEFHFISFGTFSGCYLIMDLLFNYDFLFICSFNDLF